MLVNLLQAFRNSVNCTAHSSVQSTTIPQGLKLTNVQVSIEPLLHRLCTQGL